MSTHILFDFFGTVVTYSPSRVDQGYPRSYRFLVDQGSDLTYDAFLQAWDRLFDQFERQGEASLVEFSMTDLCYYFLEQTLGKLAEANVVTTFRDTYLAEWGQGVSYIPGIREMLADLAKQYRLVLLSNTHHAELVHEHLKKGQIAPYFQHVVTSIEYGQRKPSRHIFAHALRLAGGKKETAVFVGDSYEADYLGARAAGLTCFLIDPHRQYDIPDAHRLYDVLELPSAIARAASLS
jgi:putative hydrolase of the HAD superfamily